MSDEINFKAGFVAITGLPNSGKSTLLNQFLKKKLSIISPKPQTTREHIKGILTADKYQIVFIDTPGFLKPTSKLEKIMQTEIKKAVRDDADIICLVVEPELNNLKEKKDFFTKFLKLNKKIIIAINKIDVYTKDEIESAKLFLKEILNYNDIFFEISALKGTNVDLLLNYTVENLPYSPPYYYEDILSDKWERYFVREIIRENIFNLYHKEIPYSCAVDIELFKENQNPVYILADIIVSKKSHKPIIIGEKGSKIGKLREISEKAIEEFLGKKVKLELYVKVRENWQNDINFLNELNKYYR